MSRAVPPGEARLSIGVLAHVRHPIGAPFAGGMEAHTFHLARGLLARGHDVTLYASGDSEAGVPLVPIVDEHYERRLPWARYRDSAVLQRHLHETFGRAWKTLRRARHDVVHNNTVHPLPIASAHRDGQAMLTSLHVPPFGTLRSAVGQASSPAVRYSVTSARQSSVWWEGGAPAEASVVHNGIDLAAWPFEPNGNGSAVWAGRVAPNKGTHLAIAAARLAGVPLDIVGPIEDRAYFDSAVGPLLDDTIRYRGHLDPGALARQFGRSSVLLFTPLWEEPFGLVAVEAMACGLPVASTNRGAVREVVGEAGVRAAREDAPALASAIERALIIPRKVPRARVERRFAVARMLEAYERDYRRCIAGGRTVRPGSPIRPVPPFETLQAAAASTVR